MSAARSSQKLNSLRPQIRAKTFSKCNVLIEISGGSRLFQSECANPRGGAPTYYLAFFAENSIKEIGPRRSVSVVPLGSASENESKTLSFSHFISIGSISLLKCFEISMYQLPWARKISKEIQRPFLTNYVRKLGSQTAGSWRWKSIPRILFVHHELLVRIYSQKAITIGIYNLHCPL